MPPKARSFEAFLKKRAERSRPDDKGIVNDKQERRPIASGTETNYKRALGTWRAYQRLHPGAKLDNYQTPKDLMRMVAHAIDGRYNDEKACLKTVRQYWKNATAALDRDGEKVKPEIINSTTNFIEGPLQKEMNLARQKRGRKYASMSVFLILGARLWGSDWHKYTSPKDRIDLWDGIMLNVFTSARVGEYIESTARQGSGRGLLYSDLIVGVFCNERGEPEFFMEVKKDGKGMTSTPWRK